jgi:succinate dehydrogenase / fumarate reductase flavoprotein subunit
MMGGIPTDVNGQALTVDEKGETKPVPGLFACGEIACVSVHGANRLGGNSLLDLVVFGRATGMHLGETLAANSEARESSASDVDEAMARFNRWENTQKGEDPVQIKKDLQNCMQMNFSVFREGDSMADGLKELKEIRERLKHARLDDTSKEFNTQRVECMELDNLMEVAEATAIAALERKESRGAHSRYDYPDRDDVNWLKHSLFFPTTKKLKKRDVNFKPKTVDTFEPKVRTY